MMNHQIKKFWHGEPGFSLIEVTLALGIVSIGLIAILGLLPHGIESGRRAADNTIAATIAQDVFGTLRSSAFDSTPFGSTTLNLNNSGSATEYYTQAGYDSTAGSADRYFKVTVNCAPQGSLALSRVQITTVWPALSSAPANTNIFVSQIAWYDNP